MSEKKDENTLDLTGLTTKQKEALKESLERFKLANKTVAKRAYLKLTSVHSYVNEEIIEHCTRYTAQLFAETFMEKYEEATTDNGGVLTRSSVLQILKELGVDLEETYCELLRI